MNIIFFTIGIDPSAASAILQLKETHNINVVGVGIDTPSVDSSKQLEKFPAHTKLSSANLYIIENLTNLEVRKNLEIPIFLFLIGYRPHLVATQRGRSRSKLRLNTSVMRIK